MKNKLASTVIALVLCTIFAFSNTTIAFANSTDDAVDNIEETECTDCLTDEEYHDYQMWLLETEGHMDESKLYSNGISTYLNPQNSRQYRTKIVRQMRRQIFRQMKQKAQ